MFDAKLLLDALVNAGSQAASSSGAQGGVGGVLGSILSQATQGMQGAAQDSGALGKAGDLLTQATGKTPEELIEQAKTMLGDNQLAGGAVLGALGGLLFGTSAGRSLATSAAKLGGLALIGGLAYKAYQDYSAGRPVLSSRAAAVLPAPAGSGYEAEAATDETATLYVRAMIAAAAADGDIDATERAAIIGGLQAAGFDPAGNTWLENEMANPASVDDLAGLASSPEVAAQIYTAARVAINPDTPAEKDFLAGLAGTLGLDAELVAHIDAAATGAKV